MIVDTLESFLWWGLLCRICNWQPLQYLGILHMDCLITSLECCCYFNRLYIYFASKSICPTFNGVVGFESHTRRVRGYYQVVPQDAVCLVHSICTLTSFSVYVIGDFVHSICNVCRSVSRSIFSIVSSCVVILIYYMNLIISPKSYE